MLCSEAEKEISKLERSVDNLIEVLQEKQATIDRITPVYEMVGDMTKAWEPRFDTLLYCIQELIRTYRRAEKGEKKDENE